MSSLKEAGKDALMGTAVSATNAVGDIGQTSFKVVGSTAKNTGSSLIATTGAIKGTAQGLGGGFRRGQRVLRGGLDVRNSPGRFGVSCPDR